MNTLWYCCSWGPLESVSHITTPTFVMTTPICNGHTHFVFVGKTELAKQVANYIHKDNPKVISIRHVIVM